MDRATVEEFIEHFDHHDPRLGADPHQVYSEMVRKYPVAWSDHYGGYWVISGYDEVHDAMRSYRTFNRYPTANVPTYPRQRPMIPIELDPPLHGKYRGLLTPVFAPARIAKLEPEIRAVTTTLIDSFIDRGECDFVAEFADLLPTTIFTHMMGLPAEELARFQLWKNLIMHGVFDDPTGEAERADADREIGAYLRSLLEERKRERRDDIMSVLIDSELDGEKLNDQEIVDTAYLLFLAGLDTVASSIGLHFLFLAKHPDHRDQLVKDPTLIPLAVEELLRYESLAITGYTIASDVEFHGVELKQGQRAVVNTVAASRDPHQFHNPNEVIFGRDPNRHLAFGAGPHRCVGSHLARLELKVAYEEMHRRIPSYRLQAGGTVHRHGDSIQGIDRLPLEWDI